MADKSTRDRFSLTRAVRQALRHFPILYSLAGRIYHNFCFVYEFFHIKYRYRGVRFFYPTKYQIKYLRKKGFLSQFGQEYVILKNNLIRPSGGFFVDIGANNPNWNSNSSYLEKNCDYTGIAIDPINYSEDWSVERPNTRFHNAFVGPKGSVVEFAHVVPKEGWEDQLSGALSTMDDGGKNIEYNIEKKECTPLSNILESARQSIDVMFIDVEGCERDVLDSNDWSRFQPRVIVLENFNNINRQEELRTLLAGLGYIFYMRIWISDDVYVLGSTSAS